MTKTPKKQTKFRNLWILGICIHILTFLFVLDLYFTSPIKHGMTPHKSRGEPFAKRLVVFIADGMRAEAINPMQNWDRVKYLSELRLNKSSSWGIVHTGVPTESRPGHVAIFGGLMEDPSALFTGWQANTVEFDSVINESNYAWSYGSPDIVKIFTKKDKAKLNVEYYDPSEEDFSGRTSTINLDTWVFDRVEELLTPKGNSCQAEFIRKKTQRRRMNELNLSIAKERAQCQLEKDQCKGPHHECYTKTQPCFERVSDKEIEATLKEADLDFEQFQLYPCIHKFDKIECEQLCKTGNVFFLHLLGMDTAGHVHKPDSKEYIDNLHAVDKGIRETSFLFEEFFNDNETAFLVTADHGMTNWGSHGDGSEHETEVPYILWGKGVKENKLRHDLKQTDLAPLLSSLIGVPIPVNSIGILPHKLLNGTYDQIAEAVMANVMQHVEQYTLLRREFDLDPLFTEYPMFENNYVGNFITKMETLLKRGDREKNVVRMGEEFMKDILAANSYMRNYYFRPKVITVMLGFLLWIIYLSLSIHVRDEVKPIPTFRSCRIGMRLLTVLLLIAAVYYLNSLKVKYFTYTYPVFLLSVLALFFEDEDVVNQLWIILNMPNKTTIIARTIVYGVLVQLLVFGFFNRMFCAGVVVILAFWLTQNDCAMKSKVTWLITTCTLALLQMLEPSTKFNYYGLAIGSFLWLVIYISYIYAEGREYIKRFDLKYKTMTTNIIMTPLVLYLVSAANALHVAYAFDSEIGLSDMNLVISWVVTAAILFLIPVAPKGVLTRFGHICASLIIPYTLMAVNIDLIFYSVLVLTLYYWMEIESKMELPSQNKNPLKELHFLVKYIPAGSVKVSDLYRRTYFYLALTVCYFFAIGNMASFNGFDPQWTRTYVATFNPFLMAALIVIKMIIPFFLITCAFYAIVLHSKANDTKVFTVLLLFLDQMVLNFMLFVRNEGSWLEIGKSLSHFAVMEAMAVVMLVFYAMARYVCSFRIGDAGTGYEPLDEIQEDSETNIQNLIEEGVCKRVKGAQKRKIKTKWWYVHDLISNSCKKSPIKSYGVKSSRSDASLMFPSSFFDYYVKGKDKTFESNRLESNLCVQSEKFKSQEVQCKFEDETNISSNSKKHKTQKSSRSVKNFEKILSGTKKEIFQVAFDLGIAATIEHCQNEVSKSEKTNTNGKKHRKNIKEHKLPNERRFESTVDNNKHYQPEYEHHTESPVYNLTYYDIFPTVDKIQAKELRTIYNRPFLYQEGYLNISGKFNKTPEGENSGMISHPSYDDVDCHFYSAEYSTSQSSCSLSPGQEFQASFVTKKKYTQGLRRINSAPHLETITKVVSVFKISSESDIRSRMLFEEQLHDNHNNNNTGKCLEESKGSRESNCLKKQLEKFNLNKAVYSTIQPGLNVSSKISIIRTESYFDPNELGPAGSRIFRGSRTSFDSPDVLKLAPGLSREESIYYFMNEAQKSELVQKLIASSRAKTLHEQNLINSYFKQLIRNSSNDGALPSASSSTTVSSINDPEDRFEILHKEAVRNQKRRRREHRQRVRKLLEAAKEREKERLTQEKLSKQRAEEAMKAEEERMIKALANKRSSSINLVPSQAFFNLGMKSSSEIKIVPCETVEEPLKLVIPDEDKEEDEKPTKDIDEVCKTKPNNFKALDVFNEMAEVKPEFTKLLEYFNVAKTSGSGNITATEVVKLPQPGNFPFRQPRQPKQTPVPTTKSPLIEVPVKKKKKTEPETSSDSEEEEKGKDKRKKRRKLKTTKKISNNSTNLDNFKVPTPTPEPTINDSPKDSPRRESPPKSTAPSRDRYDKSCCARKRPSAKFISNAHEMAIKLSQQAGDDTSDESLKPIARLPIRVAPGFLSTGEQPPRTNLIKPNKSPGNYSGLLQAPSECVIKEEWEVEPSSYSSSKSLVTSGRRHKLYTRSSPTLVKLHSNSTLVTEPHASEDRISIESVSGGSSSEFETDYALRQETSKKSLFRLQDISGGFVGPKDTISNESMPDSMILSTKMNDSDNSSLFSDLPDDDAVPVSGDHVSLIKFTGVTTSLKKISSREKPANTCFDLFTDAKKSFAVVGEEESLTPRFIQEDSDPSKYLVKVESWLKNIDSKPRKVDSDEHSELDQSEDQDVNVAESSITTDDLIANEEDVVPAKENERTVPIVNNQELITLDIVKSLMEQQNNALNLTQASEIVSFVLRCARDIETRQSNTISVSISKETNESTSQTCSNTADRNMSTQTSIQTAKNRTKSKFIQCTPKLADEETSIEMLEKVSSNIGIQHSFTDIGVNTRKPPETRCTAAQCCAKMADVQLATDVPQVIERRDIGVSPMKYIRRKVYPIVESKNEDIHQDLNAMGERVCDGNEYCQDYDTASGSSSPSLSPEGDAHETSPPNSPDVNMNTPRIVSPFETTIQNLRLAFSTSSRESKSSEASMLKVKNQPELPDELCSRSELLKKRQNMDNETPSVNRSEVPISSLPNTSVCSGPSTLQTTKKVCKSKSATKKTHELTLSSSRFPKKLTTRKFPSSSTSKSNSSHTPQTLDSLMSTYARNQARKPYKPPMPATVQDQGIPNPRPKVRSIPRTDFAELPEEHKEIDETVVDFHMPSTSQSTSIASNKSSPRTSGSSSIICTNHSPSPSEQVDVTNLARNWRHLTTAMQCRRRQSISQDQNYKEIEKQPKSGRHSPR